MKCRYALSTTFEFSEPVKRHVFRIRSVPANLPGQILIAGEFKTSSPQPLACVRDPIYGNLTWTGRFDAAHTALSVQAQGVVETGNMQDDRLRPSAYFILPTRLTAPGDRMMALWKQVRAAGHCSRRDETLAMMHAVHEAFAYRPGATGTTTSAEQALALGFGVCQDYSHVLISLLRLSGIPALYVAGLVQGTGVTHAWVQAWVDERWIGLDPTHDCLAQGAYVAIARGCDFEEAALERGVFLGCASQRIQTTAAVHPIE